MVGVVVAGMASACVNASTLQTARVLPKGHKRVALEVTVNRVEQYTPDSSQADDSETLPGMALSVRAGLGKKLEGQFRMSLPGVLQFGVKWQAARYGRFSLSVGAGAGVDLASAIIAGLDEDDDESDSDRAFYGEVYLPVIASVELHKFAAVYASVRLYSWRVLDKENSALVANTIGVRLGNRVGVFLEGTWIEAPGKRRDGFQVSASLYLSPKPRPVHRHVGPARVAPGDSPIGTPNEDGD